MTSTDKSTDTNELYEKVTIHSQPVTSRRVSVIIPSDDLIVDEMKMSIYSRSRIVKYLALIDIVFISISFILSIVNKTNYWFIGILLPFCICGYNGARIYNKFQVAIYNFYLLWMTVLYMYMGLSNIFFLFIGLIELYIFLYVSRLHYYLSNSSQTVIEDLQNGWNPNALVYYYY